MKKIFGALVAGVLLAGCAASGVRVTDAQLSSLKAGETTEAQALAQFGAPTMRMRLGDGSLMLVYSYVETSVRGATFIPIVGGLVGGSDVRSNSVTLGFGPDGKLLDTTSSESVYGTGMGAAAGTVSTDSTYQPRR